MTRTAAPRGGQSSAADVMLLDADTQQDLNLFDPDPEARCLYNFCNRCQTEGGAKALRRRMRAPWADADRIRATQASLRFINAHAEAFGGLPPEYLVLNVERYLREILPIIRSHSSLEFALEALSLRTQERRYFERISRGVDFSRRLLKSLTRLLEGLQHAEPAGELAGLIDELRSLLDSTLLKAVPDLGTGRGFLTTLRSDQTFRLHKKKVLRRLLAVTYELDALVAMAAVCQEPGFNLPLVESGPVRIEAVGLTHPLVEAAVPNPLSMDQDQRVLFLTGPNMAGKTTYLRAAATALYFAHLGMAVPAERFSFVPVQRLLTAISLSDDLLDGVSYFRAEALRVKAVAQAIADGYRVIAIMDEPFKGTNVKDAFDASLAILERLAQTDRCLFMVSSHLIELGAALEPCKTILYRYFEAREDSERLRFDYLLRNGLSDQRLGMRVLREEGIFKLLGSEPRGTSD